MQNFKFTVAYDGRPFFGWQRHGDKPTIQGELERALSCVTGGPVSILGAGRTDRGAHARGQVFSATLPRPAAAADALVGLGNAKLASGIELLACVPVDESFHARVNATGKVYRYEVFVGDRCPAELEGRVWQVKRALDVPRMREVCPLLVGERDFASFATRSNFKQKSTRRDMRRLEISEHGAHITFVLEADGFLYKMVRNIVRALAKVGEGKTSATAFAAMVEARDRKAAPGSAPASGLFLDRVLYPPDP